MGFWNRLFRRGPSNTEVEAMEQAIRRHNAWNRSSSAERGRLWSDMPRTGTTLVEKQVQALGFSDPSRFARIQLATTATDFADKLCAWDIPTYAVVDDVCTCFLKVASISADTLAQLKEGINSNRITLTPRFKACSTFPIVGLVLTVDTRERPMPLEAVPDLTTADVRDALDFLLAKKPIGLLLFFVGNPPVLHATGEFTTDKDALRRTLDDASTHYGNIAASMLDYRTAANEYMQSTPL